MNRLEELRKSGWSYHVGYSTGFKSYYARIWKDRDTPTSVPTPGEGNVTLYAYVYSALGSSLEEAALNVVEALGAASPIRNPSKKGLWWTGLPITSIRA